MEPRLVKAKKKVRVLVSWRYTCWHSTLDGGDVFAKVRFNCHRYLHTVDRNIWLLPSFIAHLFRFYILFNYTHILFEISLSLHLVGSDLSSVLLPVVSTFVVEMLFECKLISQWWMIVNINLLAVEKFKLNVMLLTFET